MACALLASRPASANPPNAVRQATLQNAVSCSVDVSNGAAALWGEWAVHWQAKSPGWGDRAPGRTDRLVLKQHPESPESLQGHVETAAGRLLVVGEFDEDELLLEESADGKSIRATWQAQLGAAKPVARLVGKWMPDPNSPHGGKPPREFVLVRSGCAP